jgi:Ca2+-binding RTX toxin-like protein
MATINSISVDPYGSTTPAHRLLDSDAAASDTSIASGGRYIVYTRDVGGVQDIFRYDVATGNTVQVSSTTGGADGNGNSWNAEISANGRYVVFQSTANNLVAGDTNGKSDIFRKDMVTGAIVRVSADSNNLQSNGTASNASISNDGRFIAFTSTGGDLVSGDTNQAADAFRKDMVTGNVIRVSTGPAGEQGNSLSSAQDISGDGKFVTFVTSADNFPGPTDPLGTAYRKDVTTGALVPIIAELPSGGFLSGDGRFVAHGDTFAGGEALVVRSDLVSGTQVRIDSTEDGQTPNDTFNYPLGISDSGRYAIFLSDSPAFGSNPNHLFWKDLVTGNLLEPAPITVSGATGLSLAPDGRYTAFADQNGALYRTDTFALGMEEAAAANRDVVLNLAGTNTSGFVVTWGDGATSAGAGGTASLAHAYVRAGVYNLTITANGPGGSDIETQRVVIGNGTVAGSSRVDILLAGDGADVLNAGSGNDTARGGGGADVLNGYNGDDKLDGGAGADLMRGGEGNDTYIVDNGGDVIVETAAVNRDQLLLRSSYTLNPSADVEVIAVLNPNTTTPLTITGSNTANFIGGNRGNNTIDGLGGGDAINGGLGRDTLTGAAGNDRFVFDVAIGSPNADTIVDYQVRDGIGEDDLIALDNAVFTAFADGPLSASEFLDHIVQRGRNLHYDATGGDHSDMRIFAYLPAGVILTAADFVVL